MTTEAPVTAALATLCRGLRFENLPGEAIEVAKQCLLDWLGVTIAGANEPLAGILREMGLAESASGDASLIPGGEQVSAMQAALINGAASHALDYDDVNMAMSGHPTVPVLPAALALAERCDLDAAAFLTAFIAGVEMECRIGRYVMPGHYARGFHATGTLGAFGSAAACCHLLGLSEEQWQTALGIAGSQAAGLKSMFGTMTKPLQAGKAAANGLFAAMAAARGFSAHPEVVETDQGFAATQTDERHLERALEDVGRLAICDTLFKYHAACYGTHATIEGVLRLADAHTLQADEVAAIQLIVPPGNLAMCNIQEPVTGLEGKFSMRFTAAAALCDREASEAIFTDSRVCEPAHVAVRDRVAVQASTDDPRATTVIMRLRDGREVRERVDLTIPESNLDLQWDRLSTKFLGLAAPVLALSGAQSLLAAVRSLGPGTRMRDVVHAALAARGATA